MDEQLYEYLQDNYHAEVFEMYLTIGNIIEHFGMDENYQMMLDVITNENSDSETKRYELNQIFSNILLAITKMFMIDLSDDISMSDHLAIIEAILYLEQSDNVEEIIEIIDNNEDDNESAMCSLLELVTVNSAAYYEPLIMGVHTAFLDKLREISAEIADEREIVEEEDTEVRKRVIKNIKDLLKVYNGNSDYSGIECLNLITSIESQWMNFETLVKVMGDKVFHDDMELMALNLYVLAAASTDGCMSPLTFLQSNIQQYVPSEDESRQLIPLFIKIHQGLPK